MSPRAAILALVGILSLLALALAVRGRPRAALDLDSLIQPPDWWPEQWWGPGA